jgi:hypothetical protein
MLHVGRYSFRKKLVAYRNDYCLSCEAPHRAYRVRNFEVLHIHFVPVLPLGFWRFWKCSVCGRDPHVNPHTGKMWLWIFIVFLALLSVMAWIVPVSHAENKDDVFGIWVMRFACPLVLLFFFYHLPFQRPPLHLKEKLREIQPAQEGICPLCQNALIPGTRWHCSFCGVERDVL